MTTFGDEELCRCGCPRRCHAGEVGPCENTHICRAFVSQLLELKLPKVEVEVKGMRKKEARDVDTKG